LLAQVRLFNLDGFGVVGAFFVTENDSAGGALAFVDLGR
jgi:hypothetical protein